MPRSLLLSLRIRRRWQSNEGVGAAPLAVFRWGHGRQKPCSCFRFISFFKDFIWYVPHLMARANASTGAVHSAWGSVPSPLGALPPLRTCATSWSAEFLASAFSPRPMWRSA